ncbi:hypothetical protein CA7LBN_000644 [Candidozyma auris]|uniref:CinA C-terminal domain-containing protein n=1 Tax=Candidozyma auris TaxID=498019 RepID=A0A8F3AG55_CANAR|nr:hypothetical protein CA7LBN_000644 [[Candida] auris]
MNFPPTEIQQLVEEIAAILRSKNQTLAISEAACASDFYIGGKLVYSVRQRLRLSGWSKEDIGNYVGPSTQVALKLARTTKYDLGSTYVLSETGFAGPTTDLHLQTNQNSDAGVGTVYFGVSGPNGEHTLSCETGISERSKNMTEFARLGLKFLLETLKEETSD